MIGFVVFVCCGMLTLTLGLVWYNYTISSFMRAISQCNLAARAQYYPPTFLHRLLVDHIQFRVRRENTQYCLEFRSLLTGWHTIPSSTSMDPQFYGRWHDKWVYDIESPKRGLEEAQADISKWLVDSAAIDYTQYDNRVIETIKYKKDIGT
jgi:hypothetical protein